MKNKILYLLALLLLIIPFKVDAVLCTSKAYGDLKRKAFNAQVSWELKFDANHQAYFEATVFNLDKDIILIFNDVDYEPTDGSTVVIPTMLEGGRTYEFKFYGGYDSACVEEYLYIRKLEIPKYNYYSEKDACIEYEEFPLCGKYYSGDIPSDEYFNEQLQAYIDSLKPSPKPEEPEEELSLFEELVKFYTEHLIFTVPITAALVLAVVVVVIRKTIRKKNRVKLDLKEFDI